MCMYVYVFVAKNFQLNLNIRKTNNCGQRKINNQKPKTKTYVKLVNNSSS